MVAAVVVVAAAAAGLTAGPSVDWDPSLGARERDRVGRRDGVSHRRLSMASSCSMGHSDESPSDSAVEETGNTHGLLLVSELHETLLYRSLF